MKAQRFFVGSRTVGETGWTLAVEHGTYYSGIGATFPLSQVDGDERAHKAIEGAATFLFEETGVASVQSEWNGIEYRTQAYSA